MKYEIKVRRMTDDYSGDTVAEATVHVPSYEGLAQEHDDATAIVAAGAVSVFAEGMSRVVVELGRKAMRRRDRIEASQVREATADEAEAAGRDPGMRDTGEPMMVPVHE